MEKKDKLYNQTALVGESNSGKSMSATIIAKELAPLNKIKILDLERRADLYRSKFPGVKIEKVERPYTTDKIIEEINRAKKEGFEVIIIDSASLIWKELTKAADKMSDTVKDPRRAWRKLTPKWEEYLFAVNEVDMHVITTWRVKQDSYNDNKLKVVTRDGMKGLNYDYHMVFYINDDHKAIPTKDNYDLFPNWKEPKMIDESVGKAIAKWLKEN